MKRNLLEECQKYYETLCFLSVVYFKKVIKIEFDTCMFDDCQTDKAGRGLDCFSFCCLSKNFVCIKDKSVTIVVNPGKKNPLLHVRKYSGKEPFSIPSILKKVPYILFYYTLYISNYIIELYIYVFMYNIAQYSFRVI